MLDSTTKYAENIVSGKILACKNVNLACKRHLDDLKYGSQRGLYFDVKSANKVINFFSYLSLSEGEFSGKPFKLEPVQCFIVGSLFGWKGADNYRRFRKAYIEMAKGNAKSPLAAGIGLYGLLASGEEAAEIYAAAVTRDQANILFTDAKRMIEASAKLSKRVMINVRNLAVLDTNSYFRPLSSEARSLDGKRVFMALIDEIHEHPNALVVDKMQAGTKGRREPLIFEITNAGYDRESVCWHHHVYSEQILKGTAINDEWFAFMTGLDEGDDWKNEKVWIKANPMLGVSVTYKYLREQVREAIGMPSKENIVKRLNFCEWTQQNNRWINTDTWNENNTNEISESNLVGRRCYGGLDLSSVSDISAWVMVFPDDDDPDKIDVLARLWCPEDRLYDSSNKYKEQYQMWHRQGFLETTPGNCIDFAFVRAKILEDAQRFQLIDMNIDRLFQAHQLAMELQDEGISVCGMGMGYLSFAAPMKDFERRLLARKINHGGNPVLRWMADNVAISQDPAGNIKPNKAEALAITTELPTPYGWITIEKIKVGDTLFDENGQQCKVIGVTDIYYNRKCFEVCFSDNTTIIADAGHLWFVVDNKSQSNILITTEEMAEKQKYGHQSRYAIYVSKPINTQKQNYILDPYLLGAWLGDGHSSSAHITGMDNEIFDEFKKQGYKLTFKSKRSQASTYHIEDFTKPLYELGILNNKHIPEGYLRGSFEQRLSLLQGLMDTDGCVDKPSGRNGGYCIFVNTNENIIDGVFELAASLSLKPVKRHILRAGSVGNNREAWAIGFVAYNNIPIFRLKRKFERQMLPPARISRNSKRQIQQISAVDSVPVRCIQVDSPSKLFLAGKAMIATHNSQGKIDGLVALIMAIDRLSRNVAGGASVYEERGLMAVEI